MFNNNLGAFNEEPGELSFSLLQRFTRKDTLRADFEHLDEKYKLISMYYQCTKDFSSELRSNEGFSAYFNPIEIKQNSDEVKRLGEHFTNVLRGMKDGSWAYYQTLRKPKKRQGWAKDFFGKRDTERQNLQLPEIDYPVYFLKDSSVVFDEIAKKAFEGHFRAYNISSEYKTLFENEIEEEKRNARRRRPRITAFLEDENEEWKFDEEEGLAMDQFDDGDDVDDNDADVKIESKYDDDNDETKESKRDKDEAKVDEGDESRTPPRDNYRDKGDNDDIETRDRWIDQLIVPQNTAKSLGFKFATQEVIEDSDEPDDSKVPPAMTKAKKPKKTKEKMKKDAFQNPKRRTVEDDEEYEQRPSKKAKKKEEEDDEEEDEVNDASEDEVESGEETEPLEDVDDWIADDSNASSTAVGIRQLDTGGRLRRREYRPNYTKLCLITTDTYSKHIVKADNSVFSKPKKFPRK